MEMEEESLQLVLIPWPVMGHVQIVEFANLIIHRQNLLPHLGRSLSVTVLVMKLPDYIDTVSSSFADSLCTGSSSSASSGGVNFFLLPSINPIPAEWTTRTRGYFMYNLVQSQKSNVSDFLRSRRRGTAAVVVDMLCTPMMEVADDLGLPSYVFFTSPASFLGAMLHFQTLHDEENRDVSELRTADSDLVIPSFAEPVPPEVLSKVLVDKQIWIERFLRHARDYRRAKGIIVNTFAELESHALDSFLLDSAYGSGGVPPVYPIGPIMNNQRRSSSIGSPSEAIIMEWLENQPASSVVLLCFGSQGSLHEDQVRHLAVGLERSGKRFLWSLRRQSPEGEGARFPSEYGDDAFGGVLPEGFLDRTAGTGKVVGWVPQLEVLSHRSVGGFVSHCGWNSVLESLWCGVPIATWPLHSEQEMNAFQLARELGLAVVITLSYDERENVVTAAEIERGIRELMEESGRGSEVRRRVKEMRDKSRLSVVEGGSSYISLNRLIHHLMSNIANTTSV